MTPRASRDHARAARAALLALLLVSCGDDGSPLQTFSDYPNASLLVGTAWLAERLNQSDLRVLDVRDASAYAESHVPSAVSVPAGELSSEVDGVPMEFDRAKVEAALRRAGLGPDDTVVLYDNLGMMDAARVFWTLEYVGHHDVRVLDGGWNAWIAGSYETAGDAPDAPERSYPIRLDDTKLATAEEILGLLGAPSVVIVDARSRAEYTGEVALADRGGHIPGAVNLVWRDALRGGDTVPTTDPAWRGELEDPDVEAFRSGAELEAMLDALGIDADATAITYCHTLWRGAHVYFLLRLMGLGDVRGYDGSWAEWGNRDDLPVVTGPERGGAP